MVRDGRKIKTVGRGLLAGVENDDDSDSESIRYTNSKPSTWSTGCILMKILYHNKDTLYIVYGNTKT